MCKLPSFILAATDTTGAFILYVVATDVKLVEKVGANESLVGVEDFIVKIVVFEFVETVNGDCASRASFILYFISESDDTDDISTFIVFE